ncbi:hypothetical protein A2982_00570 [candidate division WWE3 bacterium RIFCSPLOWO2_01_FULL_39_13]|uniref:Uncharacterized protein n=1 Tax=candidate division WWE3 bacterium RIFCSPLOWO2_01_FULL_39_13 TaxID=1802624 RepID=A0A1F4V3L2_UNCKA|nr:MAG: hypothetical protein A2982_00570 [candidate division WWE3 bacterium RIFCSPLOWO2_01_FULL_39_13]
MKVKYVKDFEYDAFMIWIMLSDDDPSGVKNRAKSMGISKTELKRIYGVEDYQDAKGYVENLAKKKYSKCEEDIDRVIPLYQKEWDKINDTFSSEVEKVTGRKWKYNIYKVVVGPFHPGISTQEGDTVVRSAFEDSEGQKRITAHEILMSHIWCIFFEKLSTAQTINEQIKRYLS